MKTLALAILTAAAAAAIIVDRVAITAGTQMISDSEIDQRIRLTAFESGQKSTFDAAARKKAADHLIDEKLIEHEMDVGHYPRLTPEKSQGLLSGYAKQYFKGDNKAMERNLTTYGLTVDDLQQDLAKQQDLLTFVSLRFRPSVQVTEQDVRDYFQKSIQPKLPPGSGGIDDYRSQIETIITNTRADAEVDSWLKEQRKRYRIEYLEKDLAP